MKKIILAVLVSFMLISTAAWSANGNVYLNRSFDDTTVSEFDSPSDHTLGLSLEHSFGRLTPHGLIELNGTSDFELDYTTYILGTKVDIWKGLYIDGSYTINNDNLTGQDDTHVGVIEMGYEFNIFERGVK